MNTNDIINKVLQTLILVTVVIFGATYKIKDDPVVNTKDYRPSKWATNSALDIWYGNKSMVDIMFSEFTGMMNKIVRRPGRSFLQTKNSSNSKENVTRKKSSKLIHYPNITISNIDDIKRITDILQETKVLLQDLTKLVDDENQ